MPRVVLSSLKDLHNLVINVLGSAFLSISLLAASGCKEKRDPAPIVQEDPGKVAKQPEERKTQSEDEPFKIWPNRRNAWWTNAVVWECQKSVSPCSVR